MFKINKKFLGIGIIIGVLITTVLSPNISKLWDRDKEEEIETWECRIAQIEITPELRRYYKERDNKDITSDVFYIGFVTNEKDNIFANYNIDMTLKNKKIVVFVLTPEYCKMNFYFDGILVKSETNKSFGHNLTVHVDAINKINKGEIV